MNEKVSKFIKDSARGYLFLIIWSGIILGASFLLPKFGKFTLPLEILSLLFLGFIADRLIKMIYFRNKEK